MVFGVQRIVVFIAIIALNLKTIKSLSDFCKSFHDNGQDIDYGYQPAEDQYYYLFIGHTYWQLLVNESAQTVRLLPGGRLSDWFGNQYKFAIRGDFYDQNDTMVTMTGLVHRNNNSIHWALVSVDPETGNLSMVNNEMQGTSQFLLEQGFEPSIGFDYGVFIQQIRTNNTCIEYSRSFRSLNFDPRSFEAMNDSLLIYRIKGQMNLANITHGSDDTIVDNIKDGYKAMAVFTTSDGIFFLLKDFHRILYCFGYQYLGTLGCYTEPKILVDCFQNSTQLNLNLRYPRCQYDHEKDLGNEIQIELLVKKSV